MNVKNCEGNIIAHAIIPTDVKIYYEDGMPYLDYTGETYLSMGWGKAKIHFPKIGLMYDCVNVEKGEFQNCAYPVDGSLYTLTITERQMTKKEIENELGYKIKIID